MALPKLNDIRYELELPSNGQKLNYRPFLVKEQKLLMLAEETGGMREMETAFADIVKACTFEEVDPYALPMFDIEYIFLRIRAKSVGSKVKLMVPVPNSEATVEHEVDLEEVDVLADENHTNEVDLADDIKLTMAYPTIANMHLFDDENDNNNIFELIKACIYEIKHGDDVHPRIDIKESELDDFIDSMSTEQIEAIRKFFETMTKLSHTVTITHGRGKSKKEHDVELAGLQTFFG